MPSPRAVPTCPVCGFSSRFTDGISPCSVRCAITSAQANCEAHGLTAKSAVKVAKAEAVARGLPALPDIRDIREKRYRYVIVDETKTSVFWKIDRALLLHSALNAEYTWARTVGGHRRRIYRFAPTLVPRLPRLMEDYKIVNLSDDELDQLVGADDVYWHFLRT